MRAAWHRLWHFLFHTSEPSHYCRAMRGRASRPVRLLRG